MKSGISTGIYENEHVWSSLNYDESFNMSEDTSRYYSGTNNSKVVINGKGIFEVTASGLNVNQGEYQFESVPPGDFFIRFTYGDTTQTVLTNGTDDVQNAFNKLSDTQKQAFVSGAENSGILGTSGLNSISYSGQDYKSTIYQKGVTQDERESNYNGIIPYMSTYGQNYYNNGNETNNYTNSFRNSGREVPPKQSMYYYDIEKYSRYQNVSDAKDLYGNRELEKTYSKGSKGSELVSEREQTLKNYRAEILASGTKLVTKAEQELENGNAEKCAISQRDALEELIDNTQMVAQTGVINTEIERNRKLTDVYNQDTKQYIEELSYNLLDIDLGVKERTEAQLKLSKELTNIQIRLANGQILFDTSQSVNRSLVYGEHYVHTDVYDVEGRNSAGDLVYRLRKDIAIEQTNRQEELVIAYMDEEIMAGATVRVVYNISVDNIGEVDYLDRDFYYKGITSNSDWSNVSTTNARTVIDYVTNELNYEAYYQDDPSNWTLVTTELLLADEEDRANAGNPSYNAEDNDLVNSSYRDNLNTFNILVTTNKLSDELFPRALDNEPYQYSRKEINLILSTLLTDTIYNKNLIYTNLVEILETSNTNGRRMQLSKAGNQMMPYQSEDNSEDDSTTWIVPSEVDSDSGQKVQIALPTGANKDYNRIIVISVISLGLVGIAIFIIRKKIMKKGIVV